MAEYEAVFARNIRRFVRVTIKAETDEAALEQARRLESAAVEDDSHASLLGYDELTGLTVEQPTIYLDALEDGVFRVVFEEEPE